MRLKVKIDVMLIKVRTIMMIGKLVKSIWKINKKEREVGITEARKNDDVTFFSSLPRFCSLMMC